MNYTKGEWVADNGESDLWGIFAKEDCDGIAYLCEPNGALLRPEEAEANAHLIEAAPDMYEALRRFLESSACTNNCDPNDMTCDTNFARKATAKAEGKC